MPVPNNHPELQALLSMLREGTRGEVLATLDELRKNGWLFDGSLNGANLNNANLSQIDLTMAQLDKVNLTGANLSHSTIYAAQLNHANLSATNLFRTVLNSSVLAEADLRATKATAADLSETNLYRVRLNNAILAGANLREADLSDADLRGANLTGANISKTKWYGANLNGVQIYGISAWNVEYNDLTQQNNLIITLPDEPIITVDNLEVAQFIYLLLNNRKIRDVVDTLTSKAVLILGRFTNERKSILDHLRGELRQRNYLPILFDFDKPSYRDLTETISTLAHLARFVIADLSDPRSIPQELATIVPILKSVYVQPIIQQDQREYAMYESIERYPWVLPIYRYLDEKMLLAELAEKIITPLEQKFQSK